MAWRQLDHKDVSRVINMLKPSGVRLQVLLLRGLCSYSYVLR